MPVSIVADACVVPRGLAPDDDLWGLLMRSETLLRPRPHLGVNAASATFDPEFPGHAATALAFAALRKVWPLFRELPGKPAMFIACTKGDIDDWLATGKGHGFAALENALDDMQGGLPKLRRIVSNACVSGAQAAIEAAEMLIDCDCDRALVIGTDAVTPFVAQGFAALQGLSAAGARPFDAARDGLSLGEAGCAVILQRSADANGKPRMTGWGCSNDANHISGPSRDGSGLALAIERAYAGLDRAQTVALCGHGTATRYNDAMEALAFHTVFGNKAPPVFGIKGSIGHTLGAAGLIEIAISARVARTGEIPPTYGHQQGDREFPLDVVHGKPRRVSPGPVLTTNSGFGGMNTAIVVEAG